MTTHTLSTLALSPAEAALACLTLVAHVHGPAKSADLACLDDIIAATPSLLAIAPAKREATRDLAIAIIGANEGLDSMLMLIAGATNTAEQETLYALAVDFIVRRARISPEEMRLLDLLADEFALDPLLRAAIDQAMRARSAPLSNR